METNMEMENKNNILKENNWSDAHFLFPCFQCFTSNLPIWYRPDPPQQLSTLSLLLVHSEKCGISFKGERSKDVHFFI